MATLAANVPIVFDTSRSPGLRQAPAETDVYFRGGIAHWAAGSLHLTPVDGSLFAGVMMEASSATAGDMLWIATAGRFHFAAVGMLVAEMEVAFNMPIADAFDDPSELVTSAAGDGGGVGVLDQVTSEAVSGWLDISRRASPTNP